MPVELTLTQYLDIADALSQEDYDSAIHLAEEAHREDDRELPVYELLLQTREAI